MEKTVAEKVGFYLAFGRRLSNNTQAHIFRFIFLTCAKCREKRENTLRCHDLHSTVVDPEAAAGLLLKTSGQSVLLQLVTFYN